MSNKKRVVEVRRDPSEAPALIDGKMFYGLHLDGEQEVFANAIWNKDNDIIFVNAKAGCGKTMVATGVANLLVQYGFYDNIFYIVSPYGEKKQGYLPGDLDEKSSVYFDPLFQALAVCGVDPYKVISSDITNQKNGTSYVTCMTDTFLRGQNLDNAVIIIDEAQNFTTSQLKKTLTRVEKHTKVIVIGHTEQCDLDDTTSSGFARYLAHFKDEDRAAVCSLTNNHRGWVSKHADDLVE